MDDRPLRQQTVQLPLEVVSLSNTPEPPLLRAYKLPMQEMEKHSMPEQVVRGSPTDPPSHKRPFLLLERPCEQRSDGPFLPARHRAQLSGV